MDSDERRSVVLALAAAGGSCAGLASAALAAELYARGFIMMRPEMAIILWPLLAAVVGFAVMTLLGLWLQVALLGGGVGGPGAPR